jgi:hypothetical protein
LSRPLDGCSRVMVGMQLTTDLMVGHFFKTLPSECSLECL